MCSVEQRHELRLGGGGGDGREELGGPRKHSAIEVEYITACASGFRWFSGEIRIDEPFRRDCLTCVFFLVVENEVFGVPDVFE